MILAASMGIWEKLEYYLSFSFVRYALIVGCLVALCSSLLGVTLVLKRYSFIGDGLSHVAFGVMAVASVLKLANQTILVMPVTILAAILLLQMGESARVKGDAAIAMVIGVNAHEIEHKGGDKDELIAFFVFGAFVELIDKVI